MKPQTIVEVEDHMVRITRNRCRCRKCGDTIESRSVHHFVRCSCGVIFTDGGREAIRRGWTGEGQMADYIEDLTEYDELEPGETN